MSAIWRNCILIQSSLDVILGVRLPLGQDLEVLWGRISWFPNLNPHACQTSWFWQDSLDFLTRLTHVPTLSLIRPCLHWCSRGSNLTCKSSNSLAFWLVVCFMRDTQCFGTYIFILCISYQCLSLTTAEGRSESNFPPTKQIQEKFNE